MPALTLRPQECPHRAALRVVTNRYGIQLEAPTPTSPLSPAWCPDCGSFRASNANWQTLVGMNVVISCDVPEGVDVDLGSRR